MAGSSTRWNLRGLLVLVLIILCLIPAAAAYLRNARAASGRSPCANNLRQIALGVQFYALQNPGHLFPRTRYDLLNPTPTAYTKWEASDPFGQDGPHANDVTAAMYLLLRSVDVPVEAFVCPDSPANERWSLANQRRQRYSNFPSRQYLGYSFSNPYPTAEALAARWSWDESRGSDFPVVSDMNPGGPALLTTRWDTPRSQMRLVNSLNHDREGQNVGYADGHVEFQQIPFCGPPRPTSSGWPIAYRDNIFTAGAESGIGVNSPPQDQYDAVMLPTALDGPVPPPVAKNSGDWIGVVYLVAVVVIVLLALSFWRRQKSPAAR